MSEDQKVKGCTEEAEEQRPSEGWDKPGRWEDEAELRLVCTTSSNGSVPIWEGQVSQCTLVVTITKDFGDRSDVAKQYGRLGRWPCVEALRTNFSQVPH